MPHGRRSRSRSPASKRLPRRRRSASRSSSGSLGRSPGYRRKRKSSPFKQRYSAPRRSRSPQHSRAPRRSRSFSPRKRRGSSRSQSRTPPRQRSQDGDRPLKSSGRYSPPPLLEQRLFNGPQDLDMRIRELQTGKASKFAQYVSNTEEVRNDYPKEEKTEMRPLTPVNAPPYREKQGYSPNQYLPKPSYSEPQADNVTYSNQSLPHARGSREPRRSFTPEKKQPRSRYKDSSSKGKRSISPARTGRKRNNSSARKEKFRSPSSSRESKGRSKRERDSERFEEADPKPSSPQKSSRYGPGIDSNLIAIPRRKDEGTAPIFDRPEIPVYTIRDDPSLQAEGYFGSPERYDKGFERHNRYSDSQRERQPSPQVTFRATGLDSLKFPSSVLFDKPQTTKTTTVTLGEIRDSLRASMEDKRGGSPSRNVEPSHSSDLRVAIDRKQFSPRGNSYGTDLLSRERVLYDQEKMGASFGNTHYEPRAMSEERRPVKERLGDKKVMQDMPNFRKEVDMISSEDPLMVPKNANFFQHDDRDAESNRALSPPHRPATSFYPRSTRGRGYNRGFVSRGRRPFRGRFNSYHRGFGRGGMSREYKWKHDKFEDLDKGKDDGKKDRKKDHKKREDVKSLRKVKKSKKDGHKD